MSTQQQTQNNIQTGRDGGYVSNAGKSWQEAQRNDREVNQGKRETNR